jgi:hypothetical protein
LVIGAPGIFLSTGGVMKYTNPKSYTLKPIVSTKNKDDTTYLSHHGYIGKMTHIPKNNTFFF